MTDPRGHLLDWLRDAHAMEEQAITMLNSQVERLENYPELRARMARHVEETKEQARLLSGCLARYDDDSSAMKDMIGKITAFGQGLSGVFASDEVMKGTLASYTFEQMEIASYRILIAAAEAVGDAQTRSVCEIILQQEIEMANWLYEHIPTVTSEFLRRDAMDVDAKR